MIITVFNVFVHILMVGSLALFIFLIGQLIMRTPNKLERAIRGMALFAGALVVVGSEAANLSYSDFIVGSLADVRPFGFGLFAVALPAAAGVVLAWYFVRTIRRGATFAVRLLAFLGMLASTQFLLVYGFAIEDRGFDLGPTAVPNIAFIVGLFIYIMMKLDPTAPGRELDRRSLLEWLRDVGAVRNGTSRRSFFDE